MVPVVLSCLLMCSRAQFTPTNATWNYTDQGADWTTFTNCMSTTKVQSPIDITNLANTSTNSSIKPYTADNWSLWSYSFLPDYSSATVQSDLYGYNNWVYMINSTSLGGLYAAEPTKSLTNR